MGEAAENLDVDAPIAPATVNGIKAEMLQDYISKIEELERQKRGTADDIKARYQDAKADGLDPKIMRKIIKLRATDAMTLQEEELLTDVYMRALGMID